MSREPAGQAPHPSSNLLDDLSLEAIFHRDPTGRGLASYRRSGLPLDAGQLAAASFHLASHATHVAIVTGFGVMTADGVAAETDGPPGALYLARALRALECRVTLVTDHVALPVLAAGCKFAGLDPQCLVEFPMQGDARWCERFLTGAGSGLVTHLIAIERPSPSHTLDSMALQCTREERELFASTVSREQWDTCHNMRGLSVHAHTAPIHLLFETAARGGGAVTTIGIGDGGNEIGMGKFDWATLVAAVGTPCAPWIASRIATEFALLGGVSNWAAYGLALAVTERRGQQAAGAAWHADCERQLIEYLVCAAGAVDGVTLRREATVDGLPMEAYLQPLQDMRRLLGYQDPPLK